MHAATDERPFVRAPGTGGVPKYRWEIHRLPGVPEPGKHPLRRPALQDQTVSPRVDLESLLLGQRCEADAQLADMLSAGHGGLRPPYGGGTCVESKQFEGQGYAERFPDSPLCLKML